MVNFPKTINNPSAFQASKPAGFDGVFDWSWTDGCFEGTIIRPMDFDGVVERRGNFLVFETKDVGKEIPMGQRITLETLVRIGCFTVMIIYGKLSVESFEIWFHKAPKFTSDGLENARNAVKSWFSWASKNDKRGMVLSRQQKIPQIIAKKLFFTLRRSTP